MRPRRASVTKTARGLSPVRFRNASALAVPCVRAPLSLRAATDALLVLRLCRLWLWRERRWDHGLQPRADRALREAGVDAGLAGLRAAGAKARGCCQVEAAMWQRRQQWAAGI